MNAQLFKERLDDLMAQAFTSDQGAPLGMMIVQLELNKAKCVQIQLQVDAHQRNQELAKKIIPANGKIPPLLPPR